MEPPCPLRTTRCIPHEKFPRKPYNKSFIDQVCSVKMVGYWPRSFFASLWTLTSSRSINTQKKELGQYPAILTEQTWSITHTYNSFLYSFYHIIVQRFGQLVDTALYKCLLLLLLLLLLLFIAALKLEREQRIDKAGSDGVSEEILACKPLDKLAKPFH